jgi:Family of unknown function (DUF6326)
MKSEATVFEDVKVPVKLKLAGLWTSLVLCYLYGDYFGLYKPGKLQRMLDGIGVAGAPTTQGVLLSAAILMAVPSVMVFLSLALKPRVNRWVNIILGVIFTVIMLVTMWGASWAFYFFLGAVEVALTATIVWYAWNWPKQVRTGHVSS